MCILNGLQLGLIFTLIPNSNSPESRYSDIWASKLVPLCSTNTPWPWCHLHFKATLHLGPLAVFETPCHVLHRLWNLAGRRTLKGPHLDIWLSWWHVWGLHQRLATSCNKMGWNLKHVKVMAVMDFVWIPRIFSTIIKEFWHRSGQKWEKWGHFLEPPEFPRILLGGLRSQQKICSWFLDLYDFESLGCLWDKRLDPTDWWKACKHTSRPIPSRHVPSHPIRPAQVDQLTWTSINVVIFPNSRRLRRSWRLRECTSFFLHRSGANTIRRQWITTCTSWSSLTSCKIFQKNNMYLPCNYIIYIHLYPSISI